MNNQTLKACNVFKDDEPFLEGAEFLRRAKKIPGWQNGDKKAYDYYKDKTHLAEIPKGITTLVFVNSESGSTEHRFVYCLCNNSTGWYEDSGWLDDKFGSHCRVVAL